jgi:hypothetical protein
VKGVTAALLATLVALAALAGAAGAQAPEDKAIGGAATASSVEPPVPDGRVGACVLQALCAPANGNDGRDDTRWSSRYADGEFWQVDLGRPRLVDSVALTWESAYARRYRIDTSLDGAGYDTAAQVQASFSAVDLAAPKRYRPFLTAFAPRAARFVRIVGIQRATDFGFSFWEARVFGPPDPPVPPPPPPPVPAPAAPPAPRKPLQSLVPSPIVRLTGAISARGASITLLSVRAPRTARVRIRCRGRGCPSAVPVRRGLGRDRRFREMQRTLRSGAKVEVFVTAPGTYGKYTRFVIRSSRPPTRVDRCVLHRTTRPVACPTG